MSIQSFNNDLAATIDDIKTKADGSYAILVAWPGSGAVRAATDELTSRDGAAPLVIDVHGLDAAQMKGAMAYALATEKSTVVDGLGQVDAHAREAAALGMEKISEAGRHAVGVFVKAMDGSAHGVGNLGSTEFAKGAKVEWAAEFFGPTNLLRADIAGRVKALRDEKATPAAAQEPKGPAT